jgi:hypothetical protein
VTSDIYKEKTLLFKKGEIISIFESFENVSLVSTFGSTIKQKIPTEKHSKIPIFNKHSLQSLSIPINKLETVVKRRLLRKRKKNNFNQKNWLN